jgi:membrane protein DedA with SNARE-associated domain
MGELWAEYGYMAYWIAFFWAMLEGETFVILAAAAGRATDAINPIALCVSVWVGSFLGDQGYFYVGRRFGKKIIERRPPLQEKVDSAFKIMERHETILILSFRFIYGFRNIASIACGLSKVSWLRFATINFIGAGIWAVSFVSIGWFLAGLLGADRVLNGVAIVGGAAVGLLLLKALFSYLSARKARRSVECPPKPNLPTPG